MIEYRAKKGISDKLIDYSFSDANRVAKEIAKAENVKFISSQRRYFLCLVLLGAWGYGRWIGNVSFYS